MKKITLAAAALCLLAAAPALAQQDEAGCKDYPLFTRFPNMHIVGCHARQFDLRAFPPVR